MKCYSVFKKNEILTHGTTWKNLEDIVLSEISQVQKDKYCTIPLIYEVSGVVAFIERGSSSMVVARDGRKE